jgi:hypothetical protein
MGWGWAKLMVTGPVTVSRNILCAQKRLHAVKSLTSLISLHYASIGCNGKYNHPFYFLVGFSRPPLVNFYSRLPLSVASHSPPFGQSLPSIASGMLHNGC